MSARDRPFPPGGLPPDETKIFRMALDLGYKAEYLSEKYQVEGQAGQTMIRKLGEFEFRTEFETSRPEDLMRYTVMIFYQEHLVFHAWCSRTGATETVVGLVVTCEDGEWKYRLRKRHEKEEAF